MNCHQSAFMDVPVRDTTNTGPREPGPCAPTANKNVCFNHRVVSEEAREIAVMRGSLKLIA